MEGKEEWKKSGYFLPSLLPFPPLTLPEGLRVTFTYLGLLGLIVLSSHFSLNALLGGNRGRGGR